MKKCNCDYYGTGKGWEICPVHYMKLKKKKEDEMKSKREPKSDRMLRPVTEEVGYVKTGEKKGFKVTGGGFGDKYAPPKATNIPSADDFLAAVDSVSTVKEPVKKEKNGMDVLTPEDANIRKAIDELVQWKKREKEAKAEKESREVDILDFAQKKYDEDGFGNNFQKSYRIKGITEMITFVSSDRFSSIKSDDVALLKEILGGKFEEMVQKKQSVGLKDEVLSNPELQKELMSYVPKEKFGTFFQSTTHYSTVEGFDKKLFSLGRKVVEKIRELVKQAKPSLK